ncbi:hypothetical protein [Tardiphaga sp. P5_C10]
MAGAVAFAAAIHVLSWLVQSCAQPVVLKAMSDGAAASCGEYWLNRYQSLLAGLVAILSAWLTIGGMRHQTEAARGDTAIKSLSEYAAAIGAIMGRFTAVEPRSNPNVTNERREIATRALRESIDNPIVQRALTDPIIGGDGGALALFMNLAISAALYPQAGDMAERQPWLLVWPLYMDLTNSIAQRQALIMSGKPTAHLYKMSRINQRKYRDAYISGGPVVPDEQ